MDKLILEGVRCFRSRQEVPLAPLTLLVGENSTGKTTFLAATRIAYDLVRGENEVNFNKEPFNLGSFSDIASYAGGKSGRAMFFDIGIEFDSYLVDIVSLKRVTRRDRANLVVSFRQVASHPEASNVCLEFGTHWAALKKEGKSAVLEYEVGENGNPGAVLVSERWGDGDLTRILKSLPYMGNLKPCEGYSNRGVKKALRLFSSLDKLYYRNRPFAFAPVRTKPERTYDPKTDTPRPEGGHIPMVLARMVSEAPSKWKELKESLARFGKASGLFESVTVRRPLGRKESDPFQLQVKVSGPATNLVDVGYGVSQILPILVDTIQGEKGQMFLMQQPEVHLHPQAQAELASFLAQLVKHDRKSFIIETHSDYIIDRVRLDVRDGAGLKPEDVVILYFQREAAGVKIYPIYIDGEGNLVGAPPEYRRFFLEEEKRFLLGGRHVRHH